MKPSQTAIKAARMHHKIGRFSARRMVERAGVDVRLYYLARRLEAASKVIDLMPAYLKRQAF